MIRLPRQFPLIAAGMDQTGLVLAKILSGQNKKIEAEVFFKPLPDGYYEPEFTRRNLADKNPFQETVAAGLRALKTDKTKRISLVLPDSVSRVFLLDFEDIPSKSSDLESLLKHKVKKILPFDPDSAALSYRIAYKKTDMYAFLSGFMYRPVISQFEEYFEEIGINCGLIDTRGNCLIGLYNMLHPSGESNRLYVFIDSDYMTLVAENDGEISLYRGKSLASSKRKDFIQREILQSIVFLMDKTGAGSAPETILLSNRSGVELSKFKIGNKESDLKCITDFNNDIRISFAAGSDKGIDKDLIFPVIGAAARSME